MRGTFGCRPRKRTACSEGGHPKPAAPLAVLDQDQGSRPTSACCAHPSWHPLWLTYSSRLLLASSGAHHMVCMVYTQSSSAWCNRTQSRGGQPQASANLGGPEASVARVESSVAPNPGLIPNAQHSGLLLLAPAGARLGGRPCCSTCWAQVESNIDASRGPASAGCR